MRTWRKVVGLAIVVSCLGGGASPADEDAVARLIDTVSCFACDLRGAALADADLARVDIMPDGTLDNSDC